MFNMFIYIMISLSLWIQFGEINIPFSFFTAYVLVGVRNTEYDRIGQWCRKWKDKTEEKGKVSVYMSPSVPNNVLFRLLNKRIKLNIFISFSLSSPQY